MNSSKKIFMNWPMYYLNALLTIHWHVSNSFFIPKNIINHTIKCSSIYYESNLLPFYGVIDIWWYLKYLSKNEYTSSQATMLNILSINGSGYEPFFIVTFSLQKYMQICNFPFFFGTTTIEESHVTSSIDCIKLAINSLSMFCLTITL